MLRFIGRKLYQIYVTNMFSSDPSDFVMIKNFLNKYLSIWDYYRLYLVKKYFYTINHKRLGLNYFYFALFTAMSGSVLATAIRLEMSYPGSSFFNGDSLKYLQVITAHALIMIFFVVVPIFFGGFANFLLPYHVGSKDVAFPRLNSLGFWIQPCGYLLIAKIGFVRTEYWASNDKLVNYLNFTKSDHYKSTYDFYLNEIFPSYEFYAVEAEKEYLKNWQLLRKVFLIKDASKTSQNTLNSAEVGESFINFVKKGPEVSFNQYKDFHNSSLLTNVLGLPWKIAFWQEISSIPESFWLMTYLTFDYRSTRRYIIRCANATITVAGWTFITPFSSKTKFTGVAMSGLRNRRILLSFTSISILLMFRALAVITPVLGSAMLMLILDRHWQTAFFDFTYGGDPIFFHHLFWFFGHPEVYVLVIPAFGLLNAVIPVVNYRRVASKHHLIWAIYIMNYMGFLVWGHHMYLIGLDHRSRALYSTITIMISMPATIKVVNWTYTLVNGGLKKDTVLMSIISFIFFFLVAGFTGMWLSHVSLNISMHDTLYVVAHFHLMLSGTVVMGIFVGFYFYFNTFLGLKYSRTLSYIHIIYYTAGQWCTFLPLFWVSFSGLPRRLHDYPAVYMGWQSMATVGHFLTMVGVFSFYIALFEAHLEKKLGVMFHTIIARFNKRALYYLYKIVFYQYLQNTFKLIPSKKVQSILQN